MNNKGKISAIIITISFMILMIVQRQHIHNHYLGNEVDSSFLLYYVYIPMILVSVLLIYAGSKFDELEHLSSMDSLTNVYNRRFVEGKVPNLILQSKRRNACIDFVFIDINCFKLVNDIYGHETGDKLLVNISKILVNNTKALDIVGRWGGDEFLLVIPRTDNTDTLSIVNKIHNDIVTLNDSRNTNIDISVGISSYPKDGCTLAQLVKVADKRMYDMKKNA